MGGTLSLKENAQFFVIHKEEFLEILHGADTNIINAKFIFDSYFNLQNMIHKIDEYKFFKKN